MLVFVLLGLSVRGWANGSGPVNRQVHRDLLKDAFDMIELGMPENLALTKVGQPAAASGEGCSSPDWRWYQFAEWFASDQRIEIRFRHGRVIKKLYQLDTDLLPSGAPGGGDRSAHRARRR